MEKELSRLSRSELVEIIYEMKKEELALRKQIEELENTLQEREIRLSKVGSIAEAALVLNGVFEAAQKAADDYVAAVKKRYEQEEILIQQKEEKE